MAAGRIAYVAFDQGKPSHLWMRRMLRCLDDRVAISIDQQEFANQQLARGSASRQPGVAWLPRKATRWRRLQGLLGLASPAKQNYQNQWMLSTIANSDASLVLVHFLTTAVRFSDAWASLDLPVLVHCHGYDVSWDLRTPDGQRTAHDQDYVARAQALPGNVWFIANSSYTRSRLLEIGVDPGRIFVKRFGVPIATAPRQHRQEDDPSLLFLGRLVDCKGPLETIRAFHRCLKSYGNAKLRIAGDGPLRQEVRRALVSLGLERSTEQLGAVDASNARMLRDRSILLTAHNQKGPNTLQEEAFGVSLLEAMADGLPVVTGRSGGITDFIASGENGMLFDPGDIQQHASILDELLASPQKRQAIGRAAWETVRDRFKPEDELADLQTIFDAVTGHRSRLIERRPIEGFHDEARGLRRAG